MILFFQKTSDHGKLREWALNRSCFESGRSIDLGDLEHGQDCQPGRDIHRGGLACEAPNPRSAITSCDAHQVSSFVPSSPRCKWVMIIVPV